MIYFVDEIQTPFVINDIKQIASKVDVLYLFSVDVLDNKESLPKNVIVFEAFINWNSYKPIKLVIRNFIPIIGIYLNECLKLKKILPFKQSITLITSNIFKAECVNEKFKHPLFKYSNLESIVAYSFWFYDCIYLAWMRRKGWIKKAISRAHGGDLFEERSSLSGKILFRHFQFKYLDQVYSVSKSGELYLKSKYKTYANRISTAYLGSSDVGWNENFNFDEEFVLVSCAKVRDIKRIHKIAEMLQYINFPMTWIHLGDENLNQENDDTIPLYIQNVKELASKSNIKYVPKGWMSNDEIMQFYKEQQVNLFISLSEAEGIPVSMMEAISFGIPILSTDVGGCHEIVNKKTGVLIPLDTGSEEIARMISDYKSSNKNSIEFRKGARRFWEDNFNADKNYLKFINNLNN